MNVTMERRQKRILSEIREMRKDMLAMQALVNKIISLYICPKVNRVCLNEYTQPLIPEKAIYRYFANNVFHVENIEQHIEDLVRLIYIEEDDNRTILYSSDLHIAYVFTDRGVILEHGDTVIWSVSYLLLNVIIRLFRENKLPESFNEKASNEWGRYLCLYGKRNNKITNILHKSAHDVDGLIRHTWIAYFSEKYFNLINTEKIHLMHEKMFNHA